MVLLDTSEATLLIGILNLKSIHETYDLLRFLPRILRNIYIINYCVEGCDFFEHRHVSNNE
jgi:hypothetical protein